MQFIFYILQYEQRHISLICISHIYELMLLASQPISTHLQVGVAEHHQLGAGVDLVPLDEGQVHPAHPLQGGEAGASLPRLSVHLHHLLPQAGLLPAPPTHTHRQSLGGCRVLRVFRQGGQRFEALGANM